MDDIERAGLETTVLVADLEQVTEERDRYRHHVDGLIEERRDLRRQLAGAVEALGVCVDRLVHGELPGNAEWWEKAKPYLPPTPTGGSNDG